MEEGAVPLGCGVVLEDGLEEDLLDALFMPCPFVVMETTESARGRASCRNKTGWRSPWRP